jgi:hypothetical protein
MIQILMIFEGMPGAQRWIFEWLFLVKVSGHKRESSQTLTVFYFHFPILQYAIHE